MHVQAPGTFHPAFLPCVLAAAALSPSRGPGPARPPDVPLWPSLASSSAGLFACLGLVWHRRGDRYRPATKAREKERVCASNGRRSSAPIAAAAAAAAAALALLHQISFPLPISSLIDYLLPRPPPNTRATRSTCIRGLPFPRGFCTFQPCPSCASDTIRPASS